MLRDENIICPLANTQVYICDTVLLMFQLRLLGEKSFNFLLRCDTSKPSLPSDVFQSVFSLQVLDVLSYG